MRFSPVLVHLAHSSLAFTLLWACGRQAEAPPQAPNPPAAASGAAAEAAKTSVSPAAPPANAAEQELLELRARIKKYAPTEISADISKLTEADRKALSLLIDAARLLDPIFDLQVSAKNPALRNELSQKTGELERLRFEYFKIMRGPWDRQHDHAPFIGNLYHPAGAGFYPEDLSAQEFQNFANANPTEKTALSSLYTLVKRDGSRLRAEPYSKAFAAWLEPAAQKLEAAAALTTSRSLARFLKARAVAFRHDDYYESDKAWMDAEGPVEITIGPYETYEDKLLGLKAAFEAFVTVSDPVASKDLARFKALLPLMEQHLPIDDKIKTKRGAESPIRVVDLVFTAGEARSAVQTIAFNLPNDERVRKEKGAKKVLLRNLIKSKFELIMRPIATKLLVPEQQVHLSADAFFNAVLFHELSHSLGPAFTPVAGKPVEIRLALGPAFSALEEAKADVMGVYNVLFMISRGEFAKGFREQVLVSYFAGLFRSVRFGVAEAHGQGAALQINRFLEEGAATLEQNGQFRVDLSKLEASVTKLVADLCLLQHAGNRAQADTFLSTYGILSKPIAGANALLGDIPIDVRPIYPVAGESAKD